MSKALAVATKCTTKEQFIESFYKFCDEQSFFVATLNQRPIGLETPFSINLADRTPMLRGLCVVLDAWATPANPFGRPGIRLGIRRLTTDSEDTFAKLAQRRLCQGASSLDTNAVAPPVPARAPAPAPVQAVDDPPTVPVVMPIGPVVPSVIAQLEHRTPGSDIVLPANPLMNLTDVSLEGFIDCTLYEETGSFFRADTDFGDSEALKLSDADLAEPPPPPDFAVPAAPRRPTPVSLAPPVAAPIAAPPVVVAPPVVLAPPVVVAPPVVPVVAPTPPPRPTPMPTQPPVVVAPEPPRFVAPIVEEPELAPSAPSIGRATEAVLQPIRRAKRRTYLMAAGAAIGAAVLVAIAVKASSSAASTDAEAAAAPAPTKKPTANQPEQPAIATSPTPPTPTPPTPDTEKPTPPTPTTTEPPDENGGEDEPVAAANPGEAPVVGTGPCRLDITSTPAGTKVVVDGKEIGPSPISLAGPCDKHKVDLIHPRYKQSSHFVALTPNAPKKLDVTLIRPTHQLVIKTTPPGATISIQGRRAGTSPTTVSVMGFSGIDVAITRPGYETVTKRVYSKTPTETLSVALKRYKW